MGTPNISLVGTATVGTKGQIVIPAEARDHLGIKPGDKVFVVSVHGKNALGILPESSMQEFIAHLDGQLTAIKTIVNKG